MNRFWALVCALLLGLGVAACDFGPDLKPEPEPSASQPSAGGTIQKIKTNAPCQVQGDLEGAFTSSDQLPVYIACILPAIEQWIDTVYAEMPSPNGYWFVPRGVAGPDNVGCPVSDRALLYCLGNQRVYLGEAAVWQQYTEHGDAAPAVIVAHEVTHHFQNMIQMPRATMPSDQVKYENQADCGAGAFIHWADKQGALDREDDIRDLAGSLVAASSAEGPNRDHGTVSERLGAFDSAWLNERQLQIPMYECNRYTPGTPILNGVLH